MSFVHLHTHTAYSLLDGEGTIKKILDRAKEAGQTAMAITDHGNMYGVIDFYEYAKKIGIKPILGCEVYVAARTRFDKVHELDSKNYHLILLAKNETGYKNLMKIVSSGWVEGFYYKPRVDIEILAKYSEGLIALSGCMFGVISRHFLNSNPEEAKRTAEKYIEIFGKKNFFIEIQDHGLYDQKKLNSQLIALAGELGLGLVATNDIHYVTKDDAVYQDILMCIQTGKTINDDDRMKMESQELYVKSEEEMNELFSYVPEAIQNTQKIADLCNVEIEFGKLHLPEFTLPEGYTAFDYLTKLCDEGFKKRFPDDGGEIRTRLSYELETIKAMGYVEYFLIVWDFINYAKSNGIMVGPGRGSAAGSIVSYCLEITDIDPIKYGLIFERFLNPERVTMPDIDIDFCYERRGEVIDYVNRKYGSDHVAQIITFGTMAARLAIRDVGRALDVPYAMADSVAKEIPMALDMTIETALKINPQLKAMYDSDPQIKKLIDTSIELEGLPRHASTHAAGVVITREPVTSYVPVQCNSDVITTQFTKDTVEHLGLLKMDFLGLRTLTVIRDTIENIKKSTGKTINISEIDFEDKAVYQMISRGDTDGVFQLESGGMQSFMKELRPTSIEDIIAGISLYRPGPMDSIPRYIANKNNPQNVTYKHPLLENILNVTYGCIVYQEQVMQIVRELGGYSLGRSDLVRRAMSKKKTDVMEQERKNFIYGIKNEKGEVEVEGAKGKGIDEKTAAEIFDEMMDFAKYAFNKSHAAAYAFVSYQTAYLKHHYPVEFFAALLTSCLGHGEKITKYLNSARGLGIKILPPDINKSTSAFVPDGNNIRFSLSAVKSVGVSIIDDIAKERTDNGEFTSFTNFCNRMASGKLNKRGLEALIRSGAFDAMGLHRSSLLDVYEQILDSAVDTKKNTLEGQLDFGSFFEDFGSDSDEFPNKAEMPESEILKNEKEYLGVYISGHPLDSYKEKIERLSNASVIEITENENNRFASGDKVTLCGIVNGIRKQFTKKNELMYYLTLEDLTGNIEVIVFPSHVRSFYNILKEEAVLLISGNLDIAEDKPAKLRLEGTMPVDLTAENECSKKLYIKMNSYENEKLTELKEILKGGDMPVIIYYEDSKKAYTAPKNMWASSSNPPLDALSEIFEAEDIKIIERT